MPRAVVLFSGGLDSVLAARILQEQGLEVEALNVCTMYTSCRAVAAEAAERLGVKLTVHCVGDDYLEVIRNPLYGYGKGANPCIDCRIYMCHAAKRLMEGIGACLVATGEVVGQRPMSQKRQHLELIARHCGLEDRLLRPLSARLLPPTIPERQRLIRREKLYDFNGRSRRPLIALAAELGVGGGPSPSSGCALAEPLFARRVHDLLQFGGRASRCDFELLNCGRHFRFDERTKIVIGRNAAENAALRAFAARQDAADATLLAPHGFRGPDALVLGDPADPAVAFAAALMLRYAGRNPPGHGDICVRRSGETWTMRATSSPAAESASPL